MLFQTLCEFFLKIVHININGLVISPVSALLSKIAISLDAVSIGLTKLILLVPQNSNVCSLDALIERLHIEYQTTESLTNVNVQVVNQGLDNINTIRQTLNGSLQRVDVQSSNLLVGINRSSIDSSSLSSVSLLLGIVSGSLDSLLLSVVSLIRCVSSSSSDGSFLSLVSLIGSVLSGSSDSSVLSGLDSSGQLLLQIRNLSQQILLVGSLQVVILNSLHASSQLVKSILLTLEVLPYSLQTSLGIFQSVLQSSDSLKILSSLCASSSGSSPSLLQSLLVSLAGEVALKLTTQKGVNLIDSLVRQSNAGLQSRSLSVQVRPDVLQVVLLTVLGELVSLLFVKSRNLALDCLQLCREAIDLILQSLLSLVKCCLVGLRSDDIVDIVIVVLTRHEHACGRHEQCSHKQCTN